MSKIIKTYNCNNCDAQYQKWTGRCLECGQWGSVEKEACIINQDNHDKNKIVAQPIKPVSLLSIKDNTFNRIRTNVAELDRVLGGGIVPGSLILLGGEPGVGKSTLALQLAALLNNCLYFSGEESEAQIKMRADRLGLTKNNIKLSSGTNVDSLVSLFTSKKKQEFKAVIVDSIQVVTTGGVTGGAGNVNQVRACTVKLMELAKKNNLPIIIIGQVTKDGAVAGPKTLEHLVDTVLYLEGDSNNQFRILRAAKNRFGSTDEIGVFAMEENGLQEVANPSLAFISGKPEDVPGSIVTCLIEGSRPLLIEIQALVTKTSFGYPQRKASGFDLNRLQVLIAVLSRRTGLPLDNYDVFLNIAGGLKASEPAADLAVALAIASALKNKIIKNKMVVFGEVGLGGEVRNVRYTQKRLKEIKKLGFEYAVIPSSSKKEALPGLKSAYIKNVKDLVEQVLKK